MNYSETRAARVHGQVQQRHGRGGGGAGRELDWAQQATVSQLGVSFCSAVGRVDVGTTPRNIIFCEDFKNVSVELVNESSQNPEAISVVVPVVSL